MGIRQGPTKTMRRQVGTSSLDFDFGAWSGDVLTVAIQGAANVSVTTDGSDPGDPGAMDAVVDGIQGPGDFTNWFQIELDVPTSLVKVRSTAASTNVAIGLAKKAPEKV